MKIRFWGIFALVSLVACNQTTEFQRPAIDYVNNILLDKSSSEISLLKAASKPSPSSDIAIIGNPDICDRLSSYLMDYDVHDNVDARKVNDLLPDFAGETLTLITDDFSYNEYIPKDTLELRRQTVLLSLCALDTLIHLSPYDIEGVGGKNRAKMIIYADPYLSEYGLFDVDTLFKRTDCGVPIVSSLDISLDRLSKHKAKSNIVLFYNDSLYDESIYRQRFAKKEFAKDINIIPIQVKQELDSLLIKTVDNLIDRGIYSLDALIVEDYFLDTDSIKLQYADMVSVLNESSLKYSSVFSDDFEIIDSKECVAEYLFQYLRSSNMFTHNIAFPISYMYETAINLNSSDGSLLLIPSYVQN